MTVSIKGYTTLGGRPETIVRALAAARLFDDLTGEEYIEETQRTAFRCFGIELKVQGNTYPERAESLLREMAKHNLLTIEEE